MRRVNKHIVRKVLATALLLFGLVVAPVALLPAASYAATTVTCSDGKTKVAPDQVATACPNVPDKAVCNTSGAGCQVQGGNCHEVTNGCDLIKKFVQPFIDFLSALVGVAVVISIVIGGMQYGSSGGDPQKVTAAKNRIRNSIIALITFIFLLSLLNFLIPGGLL